MKKAATIDEYISSQPKNVKLILQKIRQTVKEAAPEAQELVSYGMPAFKLNKRILLYFSAWEKHIGLYAMPSANATFKKELSSYKQGRGSVQFPFDRPVPYGLVKRIVKFRAKENMAKSRV